MNSQQVWWLESVIPGFRGPRQEDGHKFEASLDYRLFSVSERGGGRGGERKGGKEIM